MSEKTCEKCSFWGPPDIDGMGPCKGPPFKREMDSLMEALGDDADSIDVSECEYATGKDHSCPDHQPKAPEEKHVEP